MILLSTKWILDISDDPGKKEVCYFNIFSLKVKKAWDISAYAQRPKGRCCHTQFSKQKYIMVMQLNKQPWRQAKASSEIQTAQIF
jgi:hypothetical protein